MSLKLIGKVIRSQKGLIQYTKKGTPFLLVAPLMEAKDKRGDFDITLDDGTVISSKDFDPAKHSLFAVPVYGDIVNAFKEECDDDMKLEVNKPYVFAVDIRVSNALASGSRTKWVIPVHPAHVQEQFELTGESFATMDYLPLLASKVQQDGLTSAADQAASAAAAMKMRAQAMGQPANTAESAQPVAETQPAA